MWITLLPIFYFEHNICISFWLDELRNEFCKELHDNLPQVAISRHRLLDSMWRLSLCVIGNETVFPQSVERYSSMILDIVLPSTHLGKDVFRSIEHLPALRSFSSNILMKYGKGTLEFFIGEGHFDLSQREKSRMFNQTSLFPIHVSERVNFPFYSDRNIRRNVVSTMRESGYYTLKYLDFLNQAKNQSTSKLRIHKSNTTIIFATTVKDEMHLRESWEYDERCGVLRGGTSKWENCVDDFCKDVCVTYEEGIKLMADGIDIQEYAKGDGDKVFVMVTSVDERQIRTLDNKVSVHYCRWFRPGDE